MTRYKQLKEEVEAHNARLVAVSKTKPVGDILQLYQAGHRLFGENKAQELADKRQVLPKDIEWHFIGHLQTNKVKYIAPFVSLIHSIDSLKLLQEVNKQGEKNDRIIDCLLQVYIADEETKYGLSAEELYDILMSIELANMHHVRLRGLMGMATNTNDDAKIDREFAFLKTLFDHVKQEYFKGQVYFSELSMGMSSDYKIALQHGASLIRIGSILFGERS